MPPCTVAAKEPLPGFIHSVTPGPKRSSHNCCGGNAQGRLPGSRREVRYVVHSVWYKARDALSRDEGSKRIKRHTLPPAPAPRLGRHTPPLPSQCARRPQRYTPAHRPPQCARPQQKTPAHMPPQCARPLIKAHTDTRQAPSSVLITALCPAPHPPRPLHARRSAPPCTCTSASHSHEPRRHLPQGPHRDSQPSMRRAAPSPVAHPLRALGAVPRPHSTGPCARWKGRCRPPRSTGPCRRWERRRRPPHSTVPCARLER